MAVLCYMFFAFCIDFVHISLAFHYNEVVPSCPEHDEVCEFHFHINYMETMVLYDDSKRSGVPVIYRDGKLCKRDPFSCDKFSPLSDQETKKVVTVDGTRKILMTVNYEFPGTPIVVYANQTVAIHVHNALLNEGVSIHWHGMVQKNTPWMDGATMVTQCPINPGQTFQYRFKADPIGTHWYHSHQGTERAEGLAGPFIVLPRGDKRRSDIPDVEKEFIMIVQDWFREESSLDINMMERWSLFPYSKDFNSTSCFNGSRSPDNMKVATVPFHAALINGKGHYFPDKRDDPEIDILPLETFVVKKNRFYKFRMINAATVYSFRISIDEHKLQIVATDGNDVKAKEVESVIMNGGERFDIVVETNAEVGNYWIRAETLEAVNKNGEPIAPGKTLGILRYDAASNEMPKTKRKDCTSEDLCTVANCPFPKYMENVDCLPITALESTYDLREKYPVPIPNEEQDIKEVFLNFHFASEDKDNYKAAINGRVFALPSCPPQVIYEPTPRICFDDCHDHDCTDFCQCSHTLSLDKHLGSIIQIVMVNNDDQDDSSNHPIHIHGHHFHVMKIAYAETDKDTGQITGDNKDITCNGLNCKEPSWSNSDWKDGNIPGLNLKNPPMKDTVIVPRKGYTVIRFPADNPGYWYIHCHVETHQLAGMTIIMKEGLQAGMVKPPKNFPLCGSFSIENNEFEDILRGASNKPSIGYESKYMSEDTGADESQNKVSNQVQHSYVLIGLSKTGLVLGVFILMLFFTIFIALTVYTYKLRNRVENISEYMPLLGQGRLG